MNIVWQSESIYYELLLLLRFIQIIHNTMSKFNLAKAIKNNPIYARTTKPPWVERFYQVAKELGLPQQTPTAESFAQAVYQWQKSQGLTADGMLGPTSWKLLEPRTRYSMDWGAPPDWISEMPPGWQPDIPDLPEKNGITDLIEEEMKKNPSYETTLVNAGVFIASLDLGNLKGASKMSKFAGGAIVQPLVWAIQGNTGDDWDKILYGLGLFPPLTVAAGAVSVWKGYVDDWVLNKLQEVIADEPAFLAKAIYPTATFDGWSQPEIKAQTIASLGGTTWQHPNGLWVFLKLEKQGRRLLVCDYKPKKATKVWGPLLPLQPVGSRFTWHSRKGGH